MSDMLKLRNEPVTQESFDRMPALLTAYQVKLVTGWNDHELRAEVRAKRIRVWVRPVRNGCKRSYSKYMKVSVAKIVGFRA